MVTRELESRGVIELAAGDIVSYLGWPVGQGVVVLWIFFVVLFIPGFMGSRKRPLYILDGDNA